MNPLAKKIDEVIQIVEFVYHAIDEGEIDSGLNREEFKKFKELSESIYDDAVKSDLDRHLMKVEDLKAEFIRAPSWLQFETPLNLPGWWNGTVYVLYPAYRWLDAMRTVARLVDVRGKRKGRRRKGETDNDTLVLSALLKHHEYDNGRVGNFEPASNRGLAAQYHLSSAALSRFLDRKMPNGAAGYKIACHNKRIVSLLMHWNGDYLDPKLYSLYSEGRE